MPPLCPAKSSIIRGGSILEPGAVADLVVLDGNPFEHTEVLWSPQRAVIRSGTVVDA